MAVGATPRHIVALIFGQGMRPVLLGSAAGLAGAMAATRGMRGAIGALAAPDYRAYIFAIALVIAAAAAACLLPARRAAKLDPMAGLRED